MACVCKRERLQRKSIRDQLVRLLRQPSVQPARQLWLQHAHVFWDAINTSRALIAEGVQCPKLRYAAYRERTNLEMALAHMRAQMEQVVEADMEAVQASQPSGTPLGHWNDVA